MEVGDNAVNKRQRKKAAKRKAELSPWAAITPYVHRVVLMNGKVRNRALTPTLRVRKVLGLSPKYLARLRSRGVYLVDVDDPNSKDIKWPAFMGKNHLTHAEVKTGHWYKGSSAGLGSIFYRGSLVVNPLGLDLL